ncbi:MULTISPECIES: glycosyltransferase [unclassified Nocardioides]|uniref:glycosyltransferase n=1 Tax=unclassified Nocardioides TaxID=2615069 RepID=UPI00114DAF23|nr:MULTISPECIES: glycosyltransferase [unclassified Nocardioides]TQK73067.1 UDP-N-acetylglucosamine transferase subunit ALG13 [Nocardioides sp. SLBN-35]WGY02694.1 glycosyltransferase [Nocardioides sp. QY071]
MTPDQPPLVAVFLGTDHHPFDRLLRWVGSLAEQRMFRFHVQHGSTALPDGLTGTSLLGPGAMADLLDRADAVVTHGGPGSIMDAREHGHLPVVVPRDPYQGEHVDDHQQRFARFVSRTGLVVTAYDEDELATRLSLAVLTGHHVPTEHRVSPTLARFEALVEDLVHR